MPLYIEASRSTGVRRVASLTENAAFVAACRAGDRTRLPLLQVPATQSDDNTASLLTAMQRPMKRGTCRTRPAALRLYARQRDDKELEVWRGEIRVRASIRIGELVAELNVAEHDGTGGGTKVPPGSDLRRWVTSRGKCIRWGTTRDG